MNSLLWALAGSNLVAWVAYSFEVSKPTRVVVRLVEDYADKYRGVAR